MSNMITEKQYKKALDVIIKYQNQVNKAVAMNYKPYIPFSEGEIVEYIGGCNSQYLTIGKQYKVKRIGTRVMTAHNIGEVVKVVIKNDNNKPMNTYAAYFKKIIK